MMNQRRASTFAAIKKAIVTVLKVPEDEIVESANVRNLRNVDSLALMEVVAITENSLGIDIDVGLLFDVETVGAFVDLCDSLRDET
jgi:acyl carrier protein